jgi:hypothetical protein
MSVIVSEATLSMTHKVPGFLQPGPGMIQAGEIGYLIL